MKALRRLLSVLVAIAAMLSAGAWSSSVAACQIPPGMEMVTAGATAAPATPSHHRQQPHHRPAKSQPEQGPAGPRLDCAACVGVLPNFPSVGPRELMPFMPVAETFEPLSGTDPALDPPPPRG